MGDIGRFHRLILGPQPGELMAAGSLCRYRMFAAPKRIDSKGLKKVAGDFRVQDMEKRVVEINGEIVPDWLRFNPARFRTIFVGVSVDHAHTVAALFISQGIAAEAVDGKTPAVERGAIFARFRSGQTVVLCACAVVDEGLDVPEATCLQLTRPTASLRLYRQLVGRVLRPAEGKVEAIILDHTDNWQRLPAPDAAIDWQLNAEVQEPTTSRQMVADLETGEVKEGDPPPLEVESTGEWLREIRSPDETPEKLLELMPHLPTMTDFRKITERENLILDNHGYSVKQRLAWVNKKVMILVGHINAGRIPVAELEPWARRASILNSATLFAIGEVLGRPADWASSQLTLNGMQSHAHLKAKYFQAVEGKKAGMKAKYYEAAKGRQAPSGLDQEPASQAFLRETGGRIPSLKTVMEQERQQAHQLPTMR
jgi:hypothetical protein